MTPPNARPTPPPEQRRRDLVSEPLTNWGKVEVRHDGIPLRLTLKGGDRDGFEVLVELWLLDDNTVAIDKLTVADNRPVQDRERAGLAEWDRVLQRLPLAAYVRSALDQWHRHAASDTTGRDAVAEAAVKVGDKVELAARIYLAHEGHDPVKAVARIQGVPHNTAKSRIRAARSRGLLPTGDPHQGRRPDTRKDQ